MANSLFRREIMDGTANTNVDLFFTYLGLVTIVFYIIISFFMGMMFKKAGIPAWKAWVPILNSWTFLEMGGQKGWLSLLSFIPVIQLIPIVFMCIAAYRIGLNFGKEAWFVVLYIIAGPVWIIWLAVDKTAVWQSAGAQDSISPSQPAAPSFQQPSQTPEQPAQIEPQPQTQFGQTTAPQQPSAPTQNSPQAGPSDNQQPPATY